MTSLTDLSALTAEDFSARMARPVHVSADGETMALRITDVAHRGQSERPGGAFSVVFRGPKSPVIDQAIHRVEFDGEAAVDLFLVPIGEDAQGVLYEAVFA